MILKRLEMEELFRGHAFLKRVLRNFYLSLLGIYRNKVVINKSKERLYICDCIIVKEYVNYLSCSGS